MLSCRLKHNMFTHFSYTVKNFTVRYNIHKDLRALSVTTEAHKIINQVINKKISTIICRGKVIIIKTNYFPLANEIKYKEAYIKNELKKKGIIIDKILCSP